MAVIRHYASILFGVLGALLISQLPGFTLQYMHNLNGRLDEIRPIIQEFEADLVPYNYTVETALEECQISEGLLDALCDSFAEIAMRYDILLAHYEMLQAQTDYQRPIVLASGTAHRDIVGHPTDARIERHLTGRYLDLGFGSLPIWIYTQDLLSDARTVV